MTHTEVTFDTFPLAFIGRDQGGLFIDGDWIESKDLSDEGVKYLTTGNVGVGEFKEQGSGFISEETFVKLRCTEVLPGDILISRLNLPVGRACIVPDLGHRLVTSVDNVIVRPSASFDRRYLVFLLSTPHHLESTSNLARGTTMQRISRSALGRIRLAIPDLATQRQIADFLDRETARIDLLIEKKQRLVALLGEKRSAVITHAVTESVDRKSVAGGCRVTYWDESVHSSLRPLKHCCRVNPNVLPETTDPDWEFDYIDIGSVSLSEGVTNKERMRFTASPSRARKPVRDGDILVSTVRTYLRAIAAVEPSDTPQVASTGFAVLRANKGTDARFLYRVVQSNPFVEQVVSQSTGVSYPAINPSTLSNIEVPLPDLPTQRAIADFLDREISIIGIIQEKTIASIARLKEYRSALITAVVTGQIDVSTCAKSGATDRRLDAIQEEMGA